MKLYKTTFFLLLLFTALNSSAAYTFKTESALREGKWVKVAVSETGVHKLTYEDIKSLGFSDPLKVNIFGYGGAQLPEDLIETRMDDLPHVAVIRNTGLDNVFGPGDYLLFWALGPVSWKYSGEDKGYLHTMNTYSSKGYYFLSDQSPKTKNNFTDSNEITENAKDTINTYLYSTYHEKEDISLSKTGHMFVGENFSYKTTQSFSFAIPGLIDGKHNVSVHFIAQKGNNTISVKANNSSVGSALTSKCTSYEAGKNYFIRGSVNTVNQSGIKVDISINNTGDNNAYLNYILINATRKLQLYNGLVHFKINLASKTTNYYEISGASASTQIWDITHPHSPKRITNTNLKGSTLSFKDTKEITSEYIAFNAESIALKPVFVETIQNQNLHALPLTDYIMIVPKGLLSVAERLADFHRRKSNLHVTVVTDQQIYNEYSSGTPDATAYRWFLKQFHDRASQLSSNSEREANRPKYLLLFGDCLVDNRGITLTYRSSSFSKYNFLLSYQLPQSLDEGSAFMTDDYFGYLDDKDTILGKQSKIDIAIGRFPVRTIEEANNAVDKTIRYVENKELGSWKNQLIFAVDDGGVGKGDYKEHMRQAEIIINKSILEKKNIHPTTQKISYPNKAFMVEKLYFDRYEKIQSTASGRYPEVENRIINGIHSGALMVNYIGHGSTTMWADEGVLDANKIQSLYNSKLPLIVTATCDFSRFDEFTTSSGELLFLHPKGGAIALFSTTRIAYSGTNLDINKEFCNHIFDKKSNGESMTLGEIMYNTKQNLSGDSNYLNFALLGDPAIKLAYPEYKIAVTKVNNKIVSDTTNFRALEQITIEGEILDPRNGLMDETFTGTITPTVFDAEQSITTRGNFGNDFKFTFQDRSTTLFSGTDSVKNGRFKFSFRMPRDISYTNRAGYINLYAQNGEKHEAQGYYNLFRIGGTDDSVINDFEGPQITPIYLNHPSFKEGEKVNSSPLFYAYIKDSLGFNLSSTSVGHDLSLVIDEDYSKTYSLNNYFECVSGSDTEGFVRFKIPTLSEGAHTLSFRAWDTFNNSSTRTLTFHVGEKTSPKITNLYAAKNPVSRSTEQARFLIQHDRPNTEITIQLSIFNLSGIEVWNHTEKGMSDLFTSYPILWDLQCFNGAKAHPGIYLYRATISSSNSKETSETKKLIIIN